MIDLHTHSTVSDGSESPEHVVALAAAAGCSAVALTDHDSLGGIAAARRAAAAAGPGLELVPGCEISCEHHATMHILVYFIEPGEGPLQDTLIELQEVRDNRNHRMADLMSSIGLPVTYEEIQEEAGGQGAGRPHIAAILMRKGVVNSIQEAFDTWLAKGRPAYLPKERLSPAVALRLARASGGVPVLAHPLSLDLESQKLAATVAELTDLGLGGLEGIYGRYNPDERAGIAALASSHGLVVTGGSDYHGRYKPDLDVGVGRGDLDVPDLVLEQLRAAQSRPKA